MIGCPEFTDLWSYAFTKLLKTEYISYSTPNKIFTRRIIRSESCAECLTRRI